MVQLIRNDDVLFGEERGAEALVRVPAAHVGERGLASDEAGQRLLERPVHREGSADEANRARACAELVQRVLPRLHHLGDVAEPQVVVRGEDDHVPPALHLHPCALRRREVVQALVDAILLELLEFGGQAGGEAHEISRITFPASPERIAARASSILARGNRWVMTGRGSKSPAERKRRIWCQVSYILRPTTPYTVIPLKMISVAKSTGT